MSDAVSLSKVELEGMLKEASHRGASEALAAIGLSDEYAAIDMRDMRSIMKSFRMAKKIAIQSMVRRITDMVIMLIAIGAASYFLGFKMGEN